MTTMLSLILAFMLSIGGSPAAGVNPAGCPGDTGIQAPIDNNRTINHFSDDYNQKTASRAKSKKVGEAPSIKDLETVNSTRSSRFSIEKLRQVRYSDHKSYRFNSVDPVINKIEALYNPQAWNLYAYCGNNPITYFDPDGRDYDNMWLFGAERARIYREHGDKAGEEYDKFMMKSWVEAGGMATGVVSALIGILHESSSEKKPEEKDDSEKYQKYWEGKAPEQSEPYTTRRKYTEDGDIDQVTTYDKYGNRKSQYDLKDKRRGEHRHDFKYNKKYKRPYGKRSEHKKIDDKK